MYISDQDFLKLTPGMQRYWDLKKTAMDVVMFYRFGDWYVLYYDDLDICAKHITIMVTPHIGSRQIGFASSFLDKNIHILTELGYKVALCEQTENRKLMEERIKK